MFEDFIDLSERARLVRQEFPGSSHTVCWPGVFDYVSDTEVAAAPMSQIYGMFHQAIMGQVARCSKVFDERQQESADTASIAREVRQEAQNLIRLLDRFEQFGEKYREYIDAGCWDPDESDLLQ